MSDINPELAKKIEQVRRLLALSAGSKEENEMKAAAAAADRIMQSYRITQAMLEAESGKPLEQIVRKVVSQGGRRTAWREVLLYALCLHYGCAWYLQSNRVGGSYGQGAPGSKGQQSYTVVGRESDTQIVDYMFRHLETECERLCRWHAGGRGVKYAIAWLMGCAKGIAHQFHEMGEAARRNTQSVGASAAMVLLDKRTTEAQAHMYENFGVRKGVAAAIHGAQDYEAQHDGYSVGKKVQIKQGLNPATPSPKLGA